MLLDISRFVSFLFSILSIFLLLNTAFFLTATTWQQRLLACITRVVLAACISAASGLLFSLHSSPPVSFSRTLPVRIFLWALFGISVLFTLAWFLDTYYVPYLWPHQPWLF